MEYFPLNACTIALPESPGVAFGICKKNNEWMSSRHCGVFLTALAGVFAIEKVIRGDAFYPVAPSDTHAFDLRTAPRHGLLKQIAIGEATPDKQLKRGRRRRGRTRRRSVCRKTWLLQETGSR